MNEDVFLIKRIVKKGDKEAADKLISSYYDEIYYFSYKQIGNKEDALDTTQNIFLAVLNSLNSYNPKLSSFRTWLYRIAVNKIIDLKRKTAKTTIPLKDWEVFIYDDIISKIDNRDLLEKIDQYISQFSFEIQRVFRLRVYAEMTFPEISIVLGETESSIKAKYYRLVEKIRKEFNYHELE